VDVTLPQEVGGERGKWVAGWLTAATAEVRDSIGLESRVGVLDRLAGCSVADPQAICGGFWKGLIEEDGA
jgi:hypothetical protein